MLRSIKQRWCCTGVERAVRLEGVGVRVLSGSGVLSSTRHCCTRLRLKCSRLRLKNHDYKSFCCNQTCFGPVSNVPPRIPGRMLATTTSPSITEITLTAKVSRPSDSETEENVRSLWHFRRPRHVREENANEKVQFCTKTTPIQESRGRTIRQG